MLTLQKLKDMEPFSTFETGFTKDGYDAVNMYGKGQDLKWVATRGQIHDWAIYIAPADWADLRVKEMGDKVHNRESIKKLVPCDDESLEMYRD